MAALSSSVSIARELANTDSNSLTNALAVDFANYASMKLRKMLIDKGIDAAPVQEATRSLTDAVGTYLYPSDMFYVPKYIEINWFENPTTTKNFKQADKVKESDVPQGQGVGWLRINQKASSPLVDYRGDYYEIFPTPNSATWGGASGSSLATALRIFYYLQPTLYTAVTDTLTFPESTDYFSFAELLKDIYFYSLEKISKDDLEKSFQQEVGKLVRIISGDGPQPIKVKQLPVSGWEY